MCRYMYQPILILVCGTILTLTSAEYTTRIEGDVYIAGLFEIENKNGDQCGSVSIDSVMVLEATRWYIEQLNEYHALPFKLGTLI